MKKIILGMVAAFALVSFLAPAYAEEAAAPAGDAPKAEKKAKGKKKAEKKEEAPKAEGEAAPKK